MRLTPIRRSKTASNGFVHSKIMGELQHPLLRQPVLRKESAVVPEAVRHGIGIETLVRDDFSPLIHELNSKFGSSLAPRKEGHHITIITPREKKTIRSLTQSDVDELKRIHGNLEKGEGIRIDGVGFIDGSTRGDILDSDKSKKTAYVALSIPTLQEYRKKLGLPEKDFHVTLGIQGDDIHDHISKKHSDGSDIVSVIPKKADPSLQSLAPKNIPIGELYVLQSLKPYDTKSL